MLTTGELYSELGHDWFESATAPSAGPAVT
jgi:hypothetical protein